TLEFLEVNEAAVRRYGYTRDEFLAMRIVDIRAAEAVERLRANLAAARWAPPGRAWRHRVKSGEIIDVEITSHTVTFGDYAAALVTAEDVTDRVRAETALAERTAMTALTADVGVALNRPGDVRVCLQHCAEALVVHLDAAAARIWRLNPSGDVLELVAGAGMYSDIDATHRRVPLGQLTIGRIAEEQRPHITNDVIHDPLLRDADWARHEGMAAFAGYPLVVEARVVGVMGVFASRPFSDAVAGAIGSVAELVALGITRDRAEGARRLLAAIVESSEDAIFGTTLDGTVMSWNSGAERLLGYAAEEIVGGMRRDGWSGELMTRCKDGAEIRINLNTSAIRDERGAVVGLLGVARDVTEERSLEEQLRQAQKMEAIGQLAGGVAHDFNNLLTVILGNLALLADRFPDDDPDRQLLVAAEQAAERAANLTEQLLGFSRRTRLRRRP